MTCASGVSAPPEALPVAVAVTGQAFDIRRGKPDAVPFLQMNGLREADGKMRVAGKGTSGAKENLGKPTRLNSTADSRASATKAAARLARATAH